MNPLQIQVVLSDYTVMYILLVSGIDDMETYFIPSKDTRHVYTVILIVIARKYLLTISKLNMNKQETILYNKVQVK